MQYVIVYTCTAVHFDLLTTNTNLALWSWLPFLWQQFQDQGVYLISLFVSNVFESMVLRKQMTPNNVISHVYIFQWSMTLVYNAVCHSIYMYST
jgi:hypothetical protein